MGAWPVIHAHGCVSYLKASVPALNFSWAPARADKTSAHGPGREGNSECLEEEKDGQHLIDSPGHLSPHSAVGSHLSREGVGCRRQARPLVLGIWGKAAWKRGVGWVQGPGTYSIPISQAREPEEPSCVPSIVSPSKHGDDLLHHQARPRSQGGQKSGGPPGKQQALKKWRIWVQHQDPGARSLEFPLPSRPRRNRIPPFQRVGASPGPFPSASSPAGMQGPQGDFRIPGLLGAPRGTASNSPKELISIGSQGLSEGLIVPVSILAGFLPVLDSVGNGRVHRPQRTPPSPSARSEFPLPPVSGAAHPSEP